MTIFYGFVGLIFFICLFNKAWKPAGIIFIIILILTPFYFSSVNKESEKNYEHAIVYFNNRDYQKSEELLNKVDENDSENYKLAKNKLKEIKNIEEAEANLKARAAAKVKSKEVVKKKADALAEEKLKANLKWTKDNIIQNLNELDVLNGEGNFSDINDGSKAYKHDNSSDGKSNIKNPYTLELNIISNKGIIITDRNVCLKIVFNLAYQLNKHKDNIDFNICKVDIHFTNFDGISETTNSNWDNFDLGINTINNYFKKPRTDIIAVSTIDGSTSKINFDDMSFYKWIEDNFTMPEDHSVLAENASWTTVSNKGAIK